MFPLFVPFAFAMAGDLPSVQPAAVAVQEADRGLETSAGEAAYQYFLEYDQSLRARRFEEALAAAENVDPGEFDSSGKAIIKMMRASALLGLKRETEARALISEAEKLAPREPGANSALFYGAIFADRMDIAADALDRLIARAPDVVRQLDLDLTWHFLRNEPKDQPSRNEDRAIALARIGFGGPIDEDYLGMEAVEILLKRSDVEGAGELVRYIDEPELVELMLILRDFSPLWPKIEELAGSRLDKAKDSSVRAAELAYNEDPENPETLKVLVSGLRSAGRIEDAIALKSKLPDTPTEMSKISEPMGWAVNDVALALDEAKRHEESDRLFAMLIDSAAGSKHWAVNMMINRLYALAYSKQFTRAWDLMEVTEKATQARGNPYAHQLVRSLKFCTLSSLGRKDEAASLLPEFLAHAKDAVNISVEGLACAGHDDEAESLVLASIADVRFRQAFVHDLQSHALNGASERLSREVWTRLSKRPMIAAEFKRLARDLPDNLATDR